MVKGNTCKVNVTFAPIAPGARNGAVEIVDSGGNVLSSVYVYGTGTGPAVAFPPGPSVPLGSGILNVTGMAIDASGNIFVVEAPAAVKEILAAGGYTTTKTLGSGFNTLWGVAVDGAGNVFVTDYPDFAVKEILRAGGYATVKTVASGINEPLGLAVDGSGNLFVADQVDNAVKEVLAAGGYTTVKTLGSGFLSPQGVAVDASGNVFVADYGGFSGSAVKEILAAGGYATVKTLSRDFQGASAVAVDAGGDVYVASVPYVYSDGIISEIVAAGGYTTVNFVSNGVFQPFSIAVDASGNVYTAGSNRGSEPVIEFPRLPPSFDFGSTLVDSASRPLSTTVQNIGNASLVGNSLSVSPGWDQVASGGNPEDCAPSFSLAPAAECNLSISFEPTETGSQTGAAILTDNALNQTDATQSIPLSGTGASLGPLEITSLNTTYAAPYSVVIINGTNFGAAQGSSTVTFNGIATPHYAWSNTQIYVTVPGNATTGSLVVNVGGKSSNAVAFTVVPQPTVTGISPTSGPVGTVVTISGTNLLDYENKGTVTFNGKSLPIISQTSTALKVAIPTGAATGYFHVLVNDTGINTPTFTVTP